MGDDGTNQIDYEDKTETNKADVTELESSAGSILFVNEYQTFTDKIPLRARHVSYSEGQRDISYDKLFGRYLTGAKRIVVTDPYIREYYQIRNFMDFMETIAQRKGVADQVEVHLITVKHKEEEGYQKQNEYLNQIVASATKVGMRLILEYKEDKFLHDRHIQTDHGWKIVLERGLDIFQRSELKGPFDFANKLQQYRQVKQFFVTYAKLVPEYAIDVQKDTLQYPDETEMVDVLDRAKLMAKSTPEAGELFDEVLKEAAANADKYDIGWHKTCFSIRLRVDGKNIGFAYGFPPNIFDFHLADPDFQVYPDLEDEIPAYEYYDFVGSLLYAYGFFKVGKYTYRVEVGNDTLEKLLADNFPISDPILRLYWLTDIRFHP